MNISESFETCTMDALPLVPFGKYKGQPMIELLKDIEYLNWCKQQPKMIEKYPFVLNICVNHQLPTQHSKTPEHNKLQNLFLIHENVDKLLLLVKKFQSEYLPHLELTKGKVIFEGMFNWDLIIEDFRWGVCECREKYENDEKTAYTCNCPIYRKYATMFRKPANCDDLILRPLYCELKPLLGDDYPSVLRKMKTQIKLTNIHNLKKQKEELERN